jgi:hypothetical protein
LLLCIFANNSLTKQMVTYNLSEKLLEKRL